jgi:hypothetical protein
VAAAVIMMAGCSAVYSTKPVGENPVTIKAEEWDGTWINKNGAITLEVMDAEKGIIHVAWVEKMKLESYQVHLLDSGSWMFASFRESGESQKYLWAKILKDEDQLNLWAPSVDKIRVLVQKGVLPGSVEESGDVVLGELKAEHLRLLTSEEKGILFEWEKPLVLTRLTR